MDVRSLCYCTVILVIESDQISPGQELQEQTHTHTHTTDDNDIRSNTVEEHNKRTSTEFNLVTAQSTAHDPPEDCRIYGPKHVGGSFLKCFKY